MLFATHCRALADKSRAALVVVEDTSRVVEEVTVDRVVTVVAEGTSRVVDMVVVDTDRLHTVAPQHWLLQHAGCGSIALLDCHVSTCCSQVSVQQCFLFVDSCMHALFVEHACSSCRAMS